jgi:hypothetical protein
MLAPSTYGLTNAQETALLEALTASHKVRITLSVFDNNETELRQIRPNMISGSVQVDAKAAVTRSLSLQLLDPAHKLHFDSGSPAEGALFADNFVGVKYGVYVEALSRWVDVPVFLGPVTRFHRSGPVVDIEAQGKETLALEPHLVVGAYGIGKGTTVEAAVRNVMGRVGEQKFGLSQLRGRLSQARSVVPGESPWDVLTGGGDEGNYGDRTKKYKRKHMSPEIGLLSKAAGDMLLFYDGRGFLMAKPKRTAKPVFAFRHDAHVLSLPDYDYDVLEFRNHADVTGGTPKKGKGHFRGSWSLPASHPLSPYALQRNGKGRFLSIFAESDALKSNAACDAKAKKLVEAAAHEGVSASFDSLPIPMLEEGDSVRVVMDDYALEFALNQFTIPLTPDGTMAIGFNKRASLPKGKGVRSF